MCAFTLFDSIITDGRTDPDTATWTDKAYTIKELLVDLMTRRLQRQSTQR